MEKRKKVLLGIIGLALVSVGFTFAYFTMSSRIDGLGSGVDGNVTMIDGTKLKVEGTLSFNDPDIYPGHKVVSKLKVTATGDNEIITYDLIWKGKNTLQTPLNFTVYKSDDYNVVASCEKKEEQQGSLKHLSEKCSISNLSSLGEAISSGTINASTTETKTELIGGEYLTASKEGNAVYYYVILEYPNLDTPQNYDKGGVFEGKVTAEKSEAKPDINIIAAYIEQEDGSYKATNDIPTNGIFNADKSECSNGATVRWEKNELIVSNLTKSGTGCYLYFNRDKEAPVVNDFTAEATDSTISITVDASDNIGITKYYYKIDDGTPVERDTNTQTFEGLIAGQSYEITVYVTDGTNESEKITKTIIVGYSGETTLAKLGITAKEPTTNMFNNVATTDEGIFKAEDDDGISYYYRGSVTNNYLKFAGKYWRIIRINGDGTIRIIYDGTEYHANGTKTTNSAINGAKFNPNGDNAYVGFKYGKTGASTYEETHKNENKSTILQVLETWYSNNLAGYKDYIDTKAGFCGDRTPSTSSEEINKSGGAGTTSTYYGALIRLKSSKEPTLKCTNSNDFYTLKTAKGGMAGKGNNSLDYPIGLITADEVSMAGGVYDTNNSSYYLYIGCYQWTMSPGALSRSGYNEYAYMFAVTDYGRLKECDIYVSYYVRPVINLRADLKITGNGVKGDEYEVSLP